MTDVDAAIRPTDANPVDALPVHLTGFVGRGRELEQLALAMESTRLLTLTGAGGSGKTRLAREAAARVAVHADRRVVWVDLAPITDRALVAPHIAATLSIPEHAQLSAEQRLIAGLGESDTLLVLDNCEHLVDACAHVTDTLLRGCRQLRILATSREALGVLGETAWLVPRLDESEAVLLFAERARAAHPAFELTDNHRDAVEQICRRLDGIPLAIELAAARVRVLSPRQIALRLDDVFALLTVNSRTALPRHRTLRSAMDWSYALLSAREQSLLRRLAIFSGSFALEAAEVICADDDTASRDDAWLESHDVLDGVAALVDKSLLTMEISDGVARYRLLETVRQYAAEHLVASGEYERLRERHAQHYLALAEAIAPRLVGGEHEYGLLARVTREHDNLRSASGWAMETPARAEAALRFADALFWYWYGSGYWLRTGQFTEAREYLDRAIDAGRSAPTPLVGRALLARGLNGLAQGDWALARVALEESLRLIRPTNDRSALAIVLSKLGAAHLMLGNLNEAESCLEEAHALARDLTPAMVHAFVLFWFGWLRLVRGDLAGVHALHREALHVGRVLEHHRTIRAHQLSLVGRAYLAAGDLDRAAVELFDALTLHRAIGDGWGMSLDLEGAVALLAAREHWTMAVRMLAAADALRQRIGVAMLSTDAPTRATSIADARARLGPDYEREYAAGWELREDEVVAAVEACVGARGESARQADAASAFALTSPEPTIARGPMLTVHALGPLQVLVDDVLIESGAWGSARPRELLVYLLLHPDGVTKEQVGLALWPDASSAQLRNSFHVTMYRLRKALGTAADDWIVLRGDRYTVNRDRLAEFDVERFEAELADAQRALAASEDGSDQQLERALSRYRSDLLDGEPMGDWLRQRREQLQRQYVEALVALGAAHTNAQRDGRAADAYARALLRDPVHEQLTTSLMQALARVGDQAQAIRVFERFRERLARELHVAPAAETIALAERLRSGAAD